MGVDVGYRGSLESYLVVVSIGFVLVACVQMVFGWAQCRNCLARLISIPYVVRTLKGLANPKKRDAPPQHNGDKIAYSSFSFFICDPH